LLLRATNLLLRANAALGASGSRLLWLQERKWFRPEITPSLNGHPGINQADAYAGFNRLAQGGRAAAKGRLFHRHGLRQIARLINVRAHYDGGMITSMVSSMSAIGPCLSSPAA
jgi:hypothetical protein